MCRVVCFFTGILSVFSIFIGAFNAHAAGEVSVDKVGLTGSASYKVIGRYASPENKYNLIFENTGAFPVSLCVKYNYKDMHSRKKKRHYMHQIVDSGERIEIHNLNLKECRGLVHLKIRLAPFSQKKWRFPFRRRLAGAEGALTFVETKEE